MSVFVKNEHIDTCNNVNDEMMQNFLFLLQKRIDSLTNVSAGNSA